MIPDTEREPEHIPMRYLTRYIPVERAKKPGGAAAGEETVPFHEAAMEFSGANRVSHKGLPLFG